MALLLYSRVQVLSTCLILIIMRPGYSIYLSPIPSLKFIFHDKLKNPSEEKKDFPGFFKIEVGSWKANCFCELRITVMYSEPSFF